MKSKFILLFFIALSVMCLEVKGINMPSQNQHFDSLRDKAQKVDKYTWRNYLFGFNAKFGAIHGFYSLAMPNDELYGKELL